MEKFLKTSDNIKIAINHFENGFKNVVILAPGWFMTKDSKVFSSLSDILGKNLDVISFDFRGHGKSKGFYTFSAKEERDLESVINYAKDKYEKIYLIGFSLGGAISALYCGKNDVVNKLILVSSPSEFGKIENRFYSPHAFIPTLKKFELRRWLSVRPSLIMHKKEKPIDFIEKIKCPILFIGGRLDPTVYFWHIEELYKKAKCEKKLKVFDDGLHAEDLFLDFKEEFIEEINTFFRG